jgi:hypothetical protein
MVLVSDDLQFNGRNGCRAPGGDTKLVENVLNVRLRGSVAYEEAISDGPIGTALSQ